jgi:hypothetical protein
MTAVVIPFTSSHSRQQSQGWRPDEIAEVYRVVDLLGRAGVSVTIDSGRSDEDEPWLVILRDDTEDVIVHIARIDGKVMVASAASKRMFCGPTLSETLRRVVGTEVLVLPRGGASNFFFHPAALLAALIATALTHATAGASTGIVDEADDGRASRADPTPAGPSAGSDRPPPEEFRAQGSGEPWQPLGRHEGLAYPPAAVATAVATVVISVTLTGDDLLSLIKREFLQAISPTVQSAVDTEQPEDRTDQSFQAQINLVSAAPLAAGVGSGLDGSNEEVTPLAAATDGQDVAPPPVAAQADDLRPELLPWIDGLLSFRLAGHREELPAAPRNTLHGGWDPAQVPPTYFEGVELGQGMAPTEQQSVISASAAMAQSPQGHASSTVTPTAQQPLTGGAAPLSSSAGLHSTVHGPDMLEFSQFLLFREGAELLGVFKFDNLHLHADQNSDGEHSISPAPTATHTSAAAEEMASPTLQLPSLPGVVPYEASPEAKAAALTQFAYGDEHEVHVSHATLQAIRAQVAANSFLPNVDRLIIFETPRPNADQFMLMPGVAMVRSGSGGELLSHLAAQPVDFTLSDGATLRLLGMIDL